jgi:WD40 repeat protein
VIILDAETGAIQARLTGHAGWVNSVAFSPNGKSIVSCGSAKPKETDVHGGEIWLWDVTAKSGKRLWQSDELTPHCIVFSPDGIFIACGGGTSTEDQRPGFVKIWKTANFVEESDDRDHPTGVSTIAFSPDGRVLASANTAWGLYAPHRYDAKLILREVPTGQHAYVENISDWWPEFHRVIVIGDLAFSPDGRHLAIAMGSWNRGDKWGELRLWNVSAQSQVKSRPYVAEDGHPVTSAAFLPDGKSIVAATGDGKVIRWEVGAKSE